MYIFHSVKRNNNSVLLLGYRTQQTTGLVETRFFKNAGIGVQNNYYPLKRQSDCIPFNIGLTATQTKTKSGDITLQCEMLNDHDANF